MRDFDIEAPYITRAETWGMEDDCFWDDYSSEDYVWDDDDWGEPDYDKWNSAFPLPTSNEDWV